ncbi:glycosyltransferase family 4 protein [Pseudochelatococcus lubricantis]|uniref:glycosyltransferase family 4 protein n=1 Tax=Pseudochelatococcus lubricantis TaxID=1538102 RepID=UPI0035E6DC75
MKIAVIAPSPVPFAFGGAERVWLGLTQYYAYETKHVCELIKVPTLERNFREIVNGYRQFSCLDLSHFDLVISGKYPAWMVSHRNHAVYMLHRLRGLYDTWPGDLDTALPDDALLGPLRPLLEGPSTCRSQLSEIFGEIDRLLAADPPAHWLALPGPLIRAVVHKLDDIGLSTGSISRHVAISHNVCRRAGYFPQDAEPEVAYVPSDLGLAILKEDDAGTITGPDGAAPTFFTASRLDHAKRISLIIDAFRRVEGPARLVIAGDGPQRQELTLRAKGDGRISFAGRLSEQELARHYRTALAVPFVPYDEDYGLITLEALAAGRPVVTVRDAGGVLEFVEDGVTGLVTDTDPAALAAAFESLLADPERALRMGAAGRERVRPITWQNLGTALVIPSRKRPRRRIVIANSYLLWPVDTGGKRRLWSLAREFARTADVTVVSLGRDDTPAEEFFFSPHFREVRIPISPEHIDAEWALTKKLDETSVSDISAALYGHLTPALSRELRGRLAGADLAIACHPYLYRFIREAWEGPIWYDAHNVETLLKDAMLPKTPAGRAVLAEVAQLERECVEGAERILTVSEEEKAAFRDMFGKPEDRIVLVPNGTDIPADPLLERGRREALKEKLGVHGPLALYVGSWHAPNVEGAVALAGIARERPEWTFWFVGKMCAAPELRARDLPPNVSLLGLVGEDVLQTVFAAADVGINPVIVGAGTNFKVIDYAARGALVLTTPIGIRGLDMKDGEHVIVAERERMAEALAHIAGRGMGAHEGMIANAFSHVRDHFTWETILRDVVA